VGYFGTPDVGCIVSQHPVQKYMLLSVRGAAGIEMMRFLKNLESWITIISKRTLNVTV
jgi:hypothetical protein